LGCLRFNQTRREFVTEDGFQAKHGCLGQRTNMIAGILLPIFAPFPEKRAVRERRSRCPLVGSGDGVPNRAIYSRY
jgi:hypothetical protein